jgi:hypothetical protein
MLFRSPQPEILRDAIKTIHAKTVIEPQECGDEIEDLDLATVALEAVMNRMMEFGKVSGRMATGRMGRFRQPTRPFLGIPAGHHRLSGCGSQNIRRWMERGT